MLEPLRIDLTVDTKGATTQVANFRKQTEKEVIREQLLVDISKAQLDIKALQRQLKATVGENKIKVGIDILEAQSNLNKLKGQLREIDGTSFTKKLTDGFAKGIGDFKNQIASSLGAVAGTTGIVSAVASAVQAYREFGQQLKVLEGISGATTAELKKLETQAREIGASTKYTSTEIALLQTELAKLGFTAQEILNATGAITNLAIATGEEVGKSAMVVGSVIRQYQLDASQAGNVTDIMTESFNKSALGLDNFTDSIKYVGPVAKASGVSFKDTATMLGVLADNGIKGEMAGTSLRRILNSLAADGKPVGEALQDLANKGITLASAEDEVGKTAQTALLVLGQNIPKIKELGTALENSGGSAKRLADDQMKTLDGSLKSLSGAVDGLKIAFGEALAPTIVIVSEAISKFVNFLQGGATEMIGFSAGLTALGVAIIALTGPIGWIAGGILALVGAVSAYNIATKETDYGVFQSEIDTTKKSIDELNQAFNGGKIGVDEYMAKIANLQAEYDLLIAKAEGLIQAQEGITDSTNDMKKENEEASETIKNSNANILELNKLLADGKITRDDYNTGIQNNTKAMEDARNTILSNNKAIDANNAKMQNLQKEAQMTANFSKYLDTTFGSLGVTLNDLSTQKSQAEFDALRNKKIEQIKQNLLSIKSELLLQKVFFETGKTSQEQYQKILLASKEAVGGLKQTLGEARSAKFVEKAVTASGSTKSKGGGGGGAKAKTPVEIELEAQREAEKEAKKLEEEKIARANAKYDRELKKLTKTEADTRANADKIVAIEAKRETDINKIKDNANKNYLKIANDQIKKNEDIKKSQEQLADATVKSYENIKSEIEKSQKALDDYDKKIGDTKKKIADLEKDTSASIAGRAVDVQEELNASTEKQKELQKDINKETDSEKRTETQKELVKEQEKAKKLEEEMALAKSKVTPEELAKAEEIAKESPTEKLIREAGEKKLVLEQELKDLELQKADELAIYTKLNDEKMKLEAFAEAQKIDYHAKEMSRLDALAAKLKEINILRAGGDVATLGAGGTTTNNTTTNNKTVNVNVNSNVDVESTARRL